MASEEERRSKLLNDYCELRRTHPELPAQLRDFQVKANIAENCTFENQQVDILCSALDETNSSHIMVALPTGYGKSLPMLLLGLLMPKITGIVQSFQNTQNCSHYNPLPAALVHWAMSKCLPLHFFKLNFFVSLTSHFLGWFNGSRNIHSKWISLLAGWARLFFNLLMIKTSTMFDLGFYDFTDQHQYLRTWALQPAMCTFLPFKMLHFCTGDIVRGTLKCSKLE